MHRSVSALILIALLAGCAQKNIIPPPPTNTLVFPISVAVSDSTVPDPVLYVVSSNFDLNYNSGTIIAVDTSQLTFAPWPKITPIGSGLNSQGQGYVFIDNYAGEIATYQIPGTTGELGLLVPTRFDNRLYEIRATGTKLACFNPNSGSNAQDCVSQGVKLVDASNSTIRAVDPFGVAVDQQNGKVYVTHISWADDPAGTGENLAAYLVKLDAQTLSIENFFNLNQVPTYSALVIPETEANSGVYFTGIEISSTIAAPQALRRIAAGSQTVDNTLAFTSPTNLNGARGLALSSDSKRLYVGTHNPDGLAVYDLAQNSVVAFTAFPSGQSQVVNNVPSGVSQVITISRPGGDLVAVSSPGANAVIFYDVVQNRVTTVLENLNQPFGLALSVGPGKMNHRLYVTNFGNNTVDLIDVPDDVFSLPTPFARLGTEG